MRIAVLTSSRADYGIYVPLLQKLQRDAFFKLKIVAFGTHVSRFHGYTKNIIINDGFSVDVELETLILGDSEEAISNAIGNTITKFSSLWARLESNIDLAFVLGDRYEMFAAVAASVPFNIKIAHLHGGETTLGAIDNKFRHAITSMSHLHFVATESYAKRVAEIIGETNNIYNVGSISLDNLLDLELLSKREFLHKWEIDLNTPTILVTFHPETVSVHKNEAYTIEIVKVLEKVSRKYQIVITMPNADTLGTMIRQYFYDMSKNNDQIRCIENFGTHSYFSCMKYCKFLLGNTSSGIIEAASLGKYVINLGDRQEGRARSNNVIDVPVREESILEAIESIETKGENYKGTNIYYQKNSSTKVISSLKSLHVG